MAATSHPASTLAALQTLEDGGNAVDAAIAACAVQAVVEAGSTGIGGDCFAMISLRGSTAIKAYNGSGRAPAALTLDRLQAAGIESIERPSPHAVTIPGAVDAWCRLVADCGRLPMAAVLRPAIAMARAGYPITPRVAADLASEVELLREDPTACATFLIDGAAPSIGAIQRQPLLADTLEAIGTSGPDAFYRGPCAQDMVARLQAAGGWHTAEDFAATRGEYVEPISAEYRGRTIYELQPNGQGVIALLILQILARFQLGSDPLDPTYLHVLTEATRAAYAARDAYIADPVHAGDSVARLLDDAFVTRMVAQIDLERAMPPALSMQGAEHRDTVCICVVDRDRNAVSLVNSLFYGYGSGIMAPQSGVVFHNRGMGFSMMPGHPNVIAPGKRPMHTIIPAMVAVGGRVTMPFGVMGGDYQAMGHAHFISRIFDHGLDLQTAMDMPRFFPLPGTRTIEAEAPLRDRLATALVPRGFDITAPERAIGGAQAILIDWDRGVLFGASDHRKDGIALGC
jgi:gamma-glutamyltranspeptidase/glutathione hydrolase